MKRSLSVLLCVFFALGSLYAEESVIYKANQKGDNAARIGLSLTLPVRPSIKQLTTGGSAALGYDFYASENLLIGGEAAFFYNPTIGGNMYYFVPILFSAHYQFALGKFEFPVGVAVGFAIQSYVDRMYFGLDVRPQAGAYYRISSEWSAGVNAQLHCLPQLYKDKNNNYIGLISSIQLSARYHF